MTDNEMESGFELVLDNRRLIAVFAVLIIICGCFFIWGYAMGKRQGKIAAVSGVGGSMNGNLVPASDEGEAEGETPSMAADENQKDLEWYQSVNRKGGDSIPDVSASRSSDNVKKSAASEKPYVSSKNTQAVTYSVQVGAFKERQPAEAHAEEVRSKGFQARVEAPSVSGDLYHVKVGRFGTRSEAEAESLRLNKKGFNTLIKTN